MATTLHIGTEEGIVSVSEKNGSWAVESHSLKPWEVTEVLPHPAKPTVLFAATRGDGVWRSDNAGASWTKPSYGRPAPGKVRCLVCDPSDPDTLYAGAEPIALWRSVDGGSTWEEVDQVRFFPGVASIGYPVAAVEPHIRDILIDGHDPKRMLVALQVGYMLRTQDGGSTWEMLDKDVDADVHTIAADPQDSERIYIATGGHDARQRTAPGRALYRSKDGGSSWQPMAMEFQQEYSVPLVVDPTNPSTLYSAVASGNPGEWRKRESGANASLIRSRNAGESWEELPRVEEIARGYAEAIVADQARPGYLFAATRSGDLLSSKDGGESWEKLAVRVPEVSDMKLVHS